MERNRSYKTKTAHRHFFSVAAVLIVLLSACPVKLVIKNLAGVPVNSEQASNPKKNVFVANGVQQCIAIDANDITITSSSFLQVTDPSPLAVFTIIAFCLTGYFFLSKKPYTLSGQRISPSTLPIFLRHRKLII